MNRSDALTISWSKGRRKATWRGRRHGDDAKAGMRSAWTERIRKVNAYDRAAILLRDFAVLVENELANEDHTLRLIAELRALLA